MEEQVLPAPPPVSRVRRSVVALVAALGLTAGAGALSATAALAADDGAGSGDASSVESSTGDSSGLDTLQTDDERDAEAAERDCPEEDSQADASASSA